MERGSLQQVFCCRTGEETDWIWRRGGSGEGPQLDDLFSWSAQLECSQGMPAGVGGWDNGMSWGKQGGGEGLCDHLGIGSERKGRSQKAGK